ncbi:MAG: hypothetical protein ING75_17290 [Rhodocyclaceae bacterium]|nr:hypothetical protein [Rhodocyclaceae bacterium]
MELPFKTYRQHVEAAVAAFLPAVKQRAVSGINGPAYLYCRHAKPNQEGELKLFLEGETPDPRWELVTGEGLRSHIPYDHYFTWIEHRARRAPIIGWQENDLPPSTAKYIAQMMEGKTVVVSEMAYNEGANYWPSWMASLHNPNRCGILDALVIGTTEALLRDYRDATLKVRPDLAEKVCA